jgi:hypothetical protein
MNSKKLFDILDKDIRNNYDTKTEFARKAKITKQRLNQLLLILEANRESSHFNTICRTLENAGYKIIIEKK